MNDCFCSQKLSVNSNFELSNRNTITLIFFLISCPYEKIFELYDKFLLSKYTINILLLFLLYRYIHSKIQNLLDYLDEKKTTNSEIPDIYLPYMKAYYYYSIFISVNKVFFDTFVIMVSYYIFGIVYLIIKYHPLFYIHFVLGKVGIISLIFCCLIMFYSLNKQRFGIGKNEEVGEMYNIGKFSVIDVDIQQDEIKEKNTRKKNKKIDNKNKNKKNENNNYVKIGSEENKEGEKEKEHIKGTEETESLNK